MLWIEAQSTPVITVLTFTICYMMTGAIFWLALIVSRRAVARDLKGVAPVTLNSSGGHPGPRDRLSCFPGMDKS